jgi:hypothetical protein
VYTTFEEEIPSFSIMDSDEEMEPVPQAPSKSMSFWNSKKPKTENSPNQLFSYEDHIINLEEGNYGTSKNFP